MSAVISADRVRALFEYDPATGALTWRKARLGCNAGGAAGSVTNRYREIRVDGKHYVAHRLIWLYVYGRMPAMIDHANGDGDDNRLSNLRECTASQNSYNARLSKRNRAGIKGVSWCRRTGRWQVHIAAGRKRRFLGRYASLDDARSARERAAAELHGEFARIA